MKVAVFEHLFGETEVFRHIGVLISRFIIKYFKLYITYVPVCIYGYNLATISIIKRVLRKLLY